VYFGPVEIRNWLVPGQEQVITYPHPAVKLTNGVASYLHRDHLGSVRAITDATGTEIESAIYKPFGEQTETLSPANLTPESKGWIGERFDTDAGLQYLNARYYDPVLGLFLQPDWFEVLQPGVGTNRFSYSFNDPVNKLDPMGNETKPASGWEKFKSYFGLDQASRDRTHQYNAQVSLGLASQMIKDGYNRNDLVVMDHMHNAQREFSRIGTSGRTEAWEVLFGPALDAALSGAPAIIGGSQLAANSLNTGRVFWSGGPKAMTEAATLARLSGTTTLEMTIRGGAVSMLDKGVRLIPEGLLRTVTGKTARDIMSPIWESTSRSFASGARGSATAVIGEVRATSIWSTIEYPTLINNGVSIFYKVLP
jgi:RHS repeat-associated protein